MLQETVDLGDVPLESFPPELLEQLQLPSYALLALQPCEPAMEILIRRRLRVANARTIFGLIIIDFSRLAGLELDEATEAFLNAGLRMFDPRLRMQMQLDDSLHSIEPPDINTIKPELLASLRLPIRSFIAEKVALYSWAELRRAFDSREISKMGHVVSCWHEDLQARPQLPALFLEKLQAEMARLNPPLYLGMELHPSVLAAL